MLPSPGNDLSHSIKRARTKAACQPCKLRKRKCNGQCPCQSCIRYHYQCQYSAPTGSRNGSNPTHDSHISPPPQISGFDRSTDSQAAGKPTRPRLGESEVETNSGVLFPIILGRKFDSQDGSINAARGCAWNLGLREKDPSDFRDGITSLLSQSEWDDLLDVYAAKIHPVYGVLDLQTLYSLGDWRWNDPSATTNVYDSVMCGVAALGCLFTPPSEINHQHRENSLVECAKTLLEVSSMAMDPSYHDIEAWFLRTIYLRCNSSPFPTWIASCTTVHLAEIFGLHREECYADTTRLAAAGSIPCGPRRRELLWYVMVLNSWISIEWGRPRVQLQGPVTCLPPPRSRGELQESSQGIEYLLLAPITEVLFEEVDDPTRLNKALRDLESLAFQNEAPILSQTVTSFTLYRRLRLFGAEKDPDTNHLVIRLGLAGLDAVRTAIERYCPWWHILNIPLQFVCVLLSMDTEYAYARLEDALRVLELAAERFPTRKTRLTYETAERLVRLAQRRKAADASYLGNLVSSLGGGSSGGRGASGGVANNSGVGSSMVGHDTVEGQMSGMDDEAVTGMDNFLLEMDPILDFALGPFTAPENRSGAPFPDFESRDM